MANQEHVKRLKRSASKSYQGREQHPVEQLRSASEWNQWRKQYPDIQPDLTQVNFSDARLRGVNLSRADLLDSGLINADLGRADLSGANLSGATLFGADLSGANLSGANLSGANLGRTDLSGANLSGTILFGADLGRADLSGAELSGADLSYAHLLGTVFAKNDLCTAKGLTKIRHRGPSLIELYTVRLPQDGSTLHFLRCAGVPDEWIAFYRAQMFLPIQYHSCFISYSNKDEALAQRLHADLQANGVRCWFAPEDLKIGDKIRLRIDEAIHLQDKLLLLLSEHALASSWVEDEVEAAMEKENQQQREVLFPVRLDERVMQATQAWAAKLRRTRHIGDFTRWTDLREYQRAFERLLHDLKAESEKEHGNYRTQ